MRAHNLRHTSPPHCFAGLNRTTHVTSPSPHPHHSLTTFSPLNACSTDTAWFCCSLLQRAWMHGAAWRGSAAAQAMRTLTMPSSHGLGAWAHSQRLQICADWWAVTGAWAAYMTLACQAPAAPSKCKPHSHLCCTHCFAQLCTHNQPSRSSHGLVVVTFLTIIAYHIGMFIIVHDRHWVVVSARASGLLMICCML